MSTDVTFSKDGERTAERTESYNKGKYEALKSLPVSRKSLKVKKNGQKTANSGHELRNATTVMFWILAHKHRIMKKIQV